MINRHLALISVFFIYACASLLTKAASLHPFLSKIYLLCLFAAIVVLGIYAVLWQQIIKRMPVSDAYMFKGTSLVFILVLSHIFFGEIITVQNIIGSIMIIGGIALYAKS